MTISSNGKAILRVAFGDAALGGTRAPNEVTNACANQLMEYFSGRRMAFDVPLRLEGSDFQLAVWDSLMRIPYGQTRTPKELAEQMGIPKSYRQVGKAAYSCPIAVIVPSHRLVAASGRESQSSHAAELRLACRELERRFR